MAAKGDASLVEEVVFLTSECQGASERVDVDVGGLPCLASEDGRSKTLQGDGYLRGGLTFLTDVKGEVSESPVQDDEEFGGLCVDVVGNILYCRLQGGDIRGNFPAIFIVFLLREVSVAESTEHWTRFNSL